MSKAPAKPPKFTNAKKMKELVKAISMSLVGINVAVEICPTSISWKEADDINAALLEVKAMLLELEYRLAAAAS